MIFTCSAGKKGKGKDKGPRKFGTVLNLNDLEKDLEKEKDERLLDSTSPSSTTTSTTSGKFYYIFATVCFKDNFS